MADSESPFDEITLAQTIGRRSQTSFVVEVERPASCVQKLQAYVRCECVREDRLKHSSPRKSAYRASFRNTNPAQEGNSAAAFAYDEVESAVPFGESE